MCKRIISVFIMMTLMLGNFAACSSQNKSEKQTITLSYFKLSKTDQVILKTVEKAFEKKYPEMDLVIKNYSEEGYDLEKYLTTINTDLMSGKGPDIFPIADLPTAKYIKKNIFADLSPFLNNDKEFKQDKYLSNIIESSKFKDKLPAFPVTFTIKAFVASKDYIEKESIKIDDETWSLSDALKKAEDSMKDLDGDGKIDRYAFPKMKIDSLTDYLLYSENYIDYENAKISMETEEFTELLMVLKAFSDNRLTHPKYTLGDEIPYKSAKEIVYSFANLAGYRGLLGNKYILGGDELNFYKLPSSTGTNKYTFDSKLMLAINNYSKNKEMSWNLLKIFLSDEIQDLYADNTSLSGFPIQKNAIEKQYVNVFKLDWRLRDGEGWGRNVLLNKTDKKFVTDYVNKINTYTYKDTRIENIIKSELEPIISQNTSLNKAYAEKLANNIKSKLKIYMDE